MEVCGPGSPSLEGKYSWPANYSYDPNGTHDYHLEHLSSSAHLVMLVRSECIKHTMCYKADSRLPMQAGLDLYKYVCYFNRHLLSTYTCTLFSSSCCSLWASPPGSFSMLGTFDICKLGVPSYMRFRECQWYSCDRPIDMTLACDFAVCSCCPSPIPAATTRSSSPRVLEWV